MVWQQTDLECVSLRFATIFGPGRLQRHAGSINTYSSMIELPASRLPFVVERGGDEKDGLIYVLDVADAIANVALTPDRLRHRVYNVSGGEPVSNDGLCGPAIRRVIPDAQLEVGPGLDPMGYGDVGPYYMALDSSRMKEEFARRPRYDLAAAIEHYYLLVTSRAS